MYRIIFFLTIFFYIYCEVSLIIAIGSVIGAFGVIVVMLLMSMLGIWLIKQQGLITLSNLRKQMATGKQPSQSALSSGNFIMAGILFFIPGFLSDILAILLIIPLTRKILQNFLLDIIFKKLQFASHTSFYQESKAQNDHIFEAEFEYKKDQDNKKNLLE